MNAARWIFVLFGGLGLAYSLVVPAFETPDEPFHYAFARHVAQGQGLPVQEPTAPGPWAQEGSQAPLYYLIAGAATAAIDQSDFAALAVENPRANIGDPLTPGNKNFMLTSGQWRPLTGSNLALHVGRWISLLLGAATLWGIYRLACFALPAPLPPRRCLARHAPARPHCRVPGNQRDALLLCMTVPLQQQTCGAMEGLLCSASTAGALCALATTTDGRVRTYDTGERLPGSGRCEPAASDAGDARSHGLAPGLHR